MPQGRRRRHAASDRMGDQSTPHKEPQCKSGLGGMLTLVQKPSSRSPAECSCTTNVTILVRSISSNGWNKRSTSCCVLRTLASRLATTPRGTGGKRHHRRDPTRWIVKSDDHPRYTAIWNILDWPGAVFPTGLVVDPALDAIDPNFSSMGPEDSYNFVQCASSQR